MNATSISIIVAGAAIAGAVLYAAGVFDADTPDHRQAVMAQLVDPESARFRNETQNDLLDIYCGEVNSQNRMGGYVGWKRYIAYGPTPERSAWRVHIVDRTTPGSRPC